MSKIDSEEIIGMALKANLVTGISIGKRAWEYFSGAPVVPVAEVIKFADLVAAAERERIADWYARIGFELAVECVEVAIRSVPTRPKNNP